MADNICRIDLDAEEDGCDLPRAEDERHGARATLLPSIATFRERHPAFDALCRFGPASPEEWGEMLPLVADQLLELDRERRDALRDLTGLVRWRLYPHEGWLRSALRARAIELRAYAPEIAESYLANGQAGNWYDLAKRYELMLALPVVLAQGRLPQAHRFGSNEPVRELVPDDLPIAQFDLYWRWLRARTIATVREDLAHVASVYHPLTGSRQDEDPLALLTEGEIGDPRLVALLDRATPKERWLLGRLAEGDSLAEIARETGLTRNALDQRLKRLRERTRARP